MNSTAAAAAPPPGVFRPPFTASQWQELEHQALIFKYLMAGIPVPPELLLPIRRSLESMAARFYHHPAMGYCSFYGKKLDPEPGRCRRTDGKKWRCSKDAHPDSKYCERHMHRGRNRSRKPVETQNLSQTQNQSSSSSPSSTVTSIAPSGGGSSGGAATFPGGVLLQAGAAAATQVSLAGSTLNQLQMDSSPFNKDFGFMRGVKSDVDGHSFFSEASGSARSLGMDFSLDSAWRQLPSQTPYSLSKTGGTLLQSNYSANLHPSQDYGQVTLSSISKQQQQYSFFGGGDFGGGSGDSTKQESQPLRPFFDEWPKARDSWSELEDERSNRTQLSISIPMASSDFSTTSSRSPNGEN